MAKGCDAAAQCTMCVCVCVCAWLVRMYGQEPGPGAFVNTQRQRRGSNITRRTTSSNPTMPYTASASGRASTALGTEGRYSGMAEGCDGRRAMRHMRVIVRESVEREGQGRAARVTYTYSHRG